MNLYVYVGNNPVRYVDPGGFCKCGGEEDSDSRNRIGSPINPMDKTYEMALSPELYARDVGRILRTFKIKRNVEVTNNGKIIILGTEWQI